MVIEIIIFLSILSIIGYAIYQSLPDTKFEKAQKLFKAKDYIQAVDILKEILDKHTDAAVLLAECNLILGKKASEKFYKLKFFNEVIKLKNRINNLESLAKFEKIESNALLEIANIQYEESIGDIEKLNRNIEFIDKANKKGFESEFNSLKIKHYQDLAIIHFKKGIEKEKSETLLDAIQSYKTAIGYAIKSENNTIQSNSNVRILICRLKLNENIDSLITNEINSSDVNYQKELYYRYSIQLIKNKKYSKAEEIITSHLNIQSPEIDKLKEIINTEKNNYVLRKVEKINTFIEEKLQTNSVSFEELRAFYDSLHNEINHVKAINSEIAQKILSLKTNLLLRLIHQYFFTEQFDDAIKFIQQYPHFWKDLDLLKNLGICCYGIASSGKLTRDNYKEIISCWLTAVFSDKVILKSLSDTTWDDAYTFTLIDAIGFNYRYDEDQLPENVNYDEVSDTNISIGAIQRELLLQFENIIHTEIQDPELFRLVNDFYDKEKEALEKVISIVENDVFLSTPYFAIKNRINNDIIKELDNDYQDYENEEALEAGIPFINNSRNTIVYQYYTAYNLVNKIVDAITNESIDSLKKINTRDNRIILQRFNKIKNSLEDRLFNAISRKIDENDENERLISIMEECIALSPQNSRLKYQFSNYVADYCISKVNNHTINNFKALSLMKKAYIHLPENSRICKNFITLIIFNLMDILSHRETWHEQEIYDILDWLKNNMSSTFKQNSGEFNRVRNQILADLRRAGVNPILFEIGNDRDIFHGGVLTAEGLRMRKVLKYLRELCDDRQARDPFDPFTFPFDIF